MNYFDMTSLSEYPVRTVAVALIDESPLNPRRRWGDLEALAASLREGQVEPVLVRPAEGGRFELVDGARRRRAALAAGLPTLHARVGPITDEEALAVIFGKGARGNVAPLTPLEEAEGYATAMRVLGLTLDAVAARFGRSRTHVHRAMVLREGLPDEARTALESGVIPLGTAYAIARIPGEAERARATTAVLHSDLHQGPMPVRAALLWIEREVCRSLQGAPFSTADAALVPAAGACDACPWRAGNNPETYGDVGNPATCMAPACYELKVAAARAVVLGRAEKAGLRPLTAEENARVLPKDGGGLHWSSGYVEWARPVPRDLLKPEVARAPRWAELCAEAAARPVRHAALDGKGRVIELVKVEEAVLAVPAAELAIFSETARRRFALGRPLPAVAGAKGANPAARKQAAGGEEAEEGAADTEPWPERCAAWIAAVLEAAPALPPGLRARGRSLMEEAHGSARHEP